jgi:hypothetical protein
MAPKFEHSLLLMLAFQDSRMVDLVSHQLFELPEHSQPRETLRASPEVPLLLKTDFDSMPPRAQAV